MRPPLADSRAEGGFSPVSFSCPQSRLRVIPGGTCRFLRCVYRRRDDAPNLSLLPTNLVQPTNSGTSMHSCHLSSQSTFTVRSNGLNSVPPNHCRCSHAATFFKLTHSNKQKSSLASLHRRSHSDVLLFYCRLYAPVHREISYCTDTDTHYRHTNTHINTHPHTNRIILSP